MNPVVQHSPPEDKLKHFAVSSGPHWMTVVPGDLNSLHSGLQMSAW